MNFIDRILIFFAPRFVMRREQARLTIDRIQSARDSFRKYEAASNKDRLSLWWTSDSSANSEIRNAQEPLRARARDLIRNNPWAAHAVEVISTYVVGEGIRPQINHYSGKSPATVERAVDMWCDWADTPACDYDGERNLEQMQSAVIESVVTDGEVFIIRHKLNRKQMKEVASKYGIDEVVPLQLQILESDFLDTKLNEDYKDGSRIIQGIEFDPAGRRIAYHFYKSHPGDKDVLNLNHRETVRIPADRVIPVFRRDRLHQARGVTWFTRVMIRLRDLDIFEDASLRKQQVAACFSAFITGTDADEESSEEIIELKERLDSGTIEILPPGQDVKFANPPSAGDYPEFTKMQLRAIASGLGITYESLTQDLSGTNFSSGRMGHLGMARRIRKWQRQILIGQMLDPIFVWWKEAADFASPQSMNMTKLWSQWTTPAGDLIDPSKEIPSYTEAIDTNQTTLSEVLRSQGKDPETVFQERAREINRMKELGILPVGKNAKPADESNEGFEEDENVTGEEDPDQEDSGEDSQA